MKWLTRRIERWTEKTRMATADLMIRRASLVLLDCEEDEVAAIVRLAWRIRIEGGERRALALLFLRKELEQELRAKEPGFRRGA